MHVSAAGRIDQPDHDQDQRHDAEAPGHRAAGHRVADGEPEEDDDADRESRGARGGEDDVGDAECLPGRGVLAANRVPGQEGDDEQAEAGDGPDQLAYADAISQYRSPPTSSCMDR